MTPPTAQQTELDGPTLNRRRVLQGLAAAGVVSVAGCLGDDDGEADLDEAFAVDRIDVSEIAEQAPERLEEPQGRLEFALERSEIDDYDQADSSLADDSTVFNLLYEGLIVQNPEGEVYEWLAAEYETVDAQDIDATDYEEYMVEEEIVDTTDFNLPIFDVERPNVALLEHPEDLAEVLAGEREAGDTVRVLDREGAADAVADGVYGSRVEGRFHEGIEFTNGEELTAGDLVGSYDRFAGSVNEGQVFDSFLHAEAPDGEDGYEFALYSQLPDAQAELQLPPFQIYPSEHLDIPPGELEPRDDGPVPIGMGPYQVESFEAGSELLLTYNENYWVDQMGLEVFPWVDELDNPDDFPTGPRVEEINIRFVPEQGTRVAGLQDGSIDMSYQLPADDRTAFQADEDYTVAAAPSTGFKFMQFPMAEPEGDEGGAFVHQEVRQAVSNLIPREDIVEVVAEGWGDPAQLPFPRPAAGLGTAKGYDELIEEDWSYPIQPDEDAAEALIDEAGLETPIEMIIETNADDEERQDKMQVAVGALNDSGLFEAEVEAPAEIGAWTQESLYAAGSRFEYAERNATAVIGLASGFDPHGYAEAVHHPDNHNGCCNFFHAEGTFDDEFVELLDSCRFGLDVVEDPNLRRERYDELWEQIATVTGNTFIDFSLETIVAGPRVTGLNGYPDRRAFLTYGLWAPYDEQLVLLDLEEDLDI